MRSASAFVAFLAVSNLVVSHFFSVAISLSSKMGKFRTDIGVAGNASKDNDSYDDNLECDVLIVGAGFGGVYLMHRLRDELGLKCKIYEAGSELGYGPHIQTMFHSP